jgi:hypothetical protein
MLLMVNLDKYKPNEILLNHKTKIKCEQKSLPLFKILLISVLCLI